MYKRLLSLFGAGNIRVYGRGIPNVFMTNGKVDRAKVEQLMGWK
ncbi:hypothetical protein [Bacillus sp. Hm123]